MPVTPISGITTPTNSQDPNGAAQLQEIVETIDGICVPKFASTAARDAAIPSPAKGQMCYITGRSFQMNYTGALSGWRFITPTLVNRITSDVARTSTTTPAEVSPLNIPIKAGRTYLIEYILLFTGDPGVDIGWSLNYSTASSPRVRMHCEAINSGTTNSSLADMDWGGSFNPQGVLFISGIDSDGNGLLRLLVTYTANVDATLSFRFAQGVSSVLSTTLKTGSYVAYKEIS